MSTSVSIAAKPGTYPAPVSLSMIASCPWSGACLFSPSSGTPPFTSTLSIAIPTTAASTWYYAGVKATQGPYFQQQAYKINVVSTGSFDYTLVVSPATSAATTEVPGEHYWKLSADVTHIAGIPSEAVTLAIDGCPPASACSFDVATYTPTFFSKINITTTSATPPGSYVIGVTGTGGGVTKTDSHTITVP